MIAARDPIERERQLLLRCARTPLSASESPIATASFQNFMLISSRSGRCKRTMGAVLDEQQRLVVTAWFARTIGAAPWTCQCNCLVA